MIARPACFSARAVADAVGGTLLGPDQPLAGIATDTRDPLQNRLFVALVGERFDAHAFLETAVQGGARGLLVSDTGWAKSGLSAGPTSVVLVQDTLRALGDLAQAHRQRQGVGVFALTGSNGKTTTKEITAAILNQARPCLKTLGNLNNLIGLPLTLLGLEDAHRLAVVEMGMNEPGEISRHTEIAEPDAGLVLNVGPAHIGELGSMQAIADAKGELLRGLGPRATLVVNADDPYVVAQYEATGRSGCRTFGRAEDADVCLRAVTVHATGQTLELTVDGQTVQANLPLAGAHNALNAAGAIALATARPDLVSISLEHIKAGLEATEVPGGRLAMKQLGSIWVLDDCYNANRASMEAALQTASDLAAQRGAKVVALLGEMRELGDYSDGEHAAVGRAAAAAKVAALAAFGPLALPMAQAAQDEGLPAHHETDNDIALLTWVRTHLDEGDVILLKGSRGIRMERFLTLLAEED